MSWILWKSTATSETPLNVRLSSFFSFPLNAPEYSACDIAAIIFQAQLEKPHHFYLRSLWYSNKLVLVFGTHLELNVYLFEVASGPFFILYRVVLILLLWMLIIYCGHDWILSSMH